VSSGVKYHNPIRVVVNFVLYNPSETRFNSENSFTTAFTNLVTEDSGIAGHVASKSYVGLVIHFNLVLLYMSVGRLDKEDALSIILHDFVVLDYDSCEVRSLNSSTFILGDG